MSDKNKLNPEILITLPHGEQSLRPCEMDSGYKIHNQLFELSSNSDDSAIVMTGEELTDFANKWLAYCKKHKHNY